MSGYYGKTTCLATPGLAAYLTHKQSDLIVYLGLDSATTREISDDFTELNEADSFNGDARFIKWWGTTPTSIYGSLKILERRGVARVREDSKWELTYKGRQIFEELH